MLNQENGMKVFIIESSYPRDFYKQKRVAQTYAFWAFVCGSSSVQ